MLFYVFFVDKLLAAAKLGKALGLSRVCCTLPLYTQADPVAADGIGASLYRVYHSAI